MNKFQFRYAFAYETKECNSLLLANDNYNFFKQDSYDFLLSKKYEVINEVSNRFLSKDDRVMGMIFLFFTKKYCMNLIGSYNRSTSSS